MSETIAELDDIRVFVRVVQEGSFTAAGRRMGLPKSTVSRRVSELEERVGVRLLHRTTRRLSLTEEGSLYFERAAGAVADLEDAQRALAALSDEPRGTLRLSAPVDFGLSYLLDLVGEFQALHPEVSVVLELSNRYVDLVAEGFDLAIRAGRLDDSSLVARKLTNSVLELYASPDYLCEHSAPTAPADLAGHRCIAFGRALSESWVLTGPGGARAEVKVQGQLASNDFGFLRRACVAGHGIARLPEMEAAGDVSRGTLTRVLPDWRSTRSALHAVYPSPRHLTPRVRAFIDFAAERLAERAPG